MGTLLVFGRFSFDDRQKRIKRYEFLFENGFERSGPKKIQINV